LARLRAGGALAELGFSELRFTRQESAELLARLTGRPPSSEELDRLLSSTEGWATGLILAALGSNAAQGLCSSPAGGAAGERQTFEYRPGEVLARHPHMVRDFLLACASLDRFNGALCDAVTQRRGSRQLLRRLERENLFLEPLDEGHVWYRFHRLFADFL